ncbi:hypothetical protein [Priestia megaterium]|uniref:hypothetical protein n=1 Tax=Priestia megaterium TaxID=1404 RepID=UPI002E1DDD56|nr:hypothetical protein [Priestia megaterium]
MKKIIRLFDDFLEGATLEIFNKESGEKAAEELKKMINSKFKNKYYRFKTYNDYNSILLSTENLSFGEMKDILNNCHNIIKILIFKHQNRFAAKYIWGKNFSIFMPTEMKKWHILTMDIGIKVMNQIIRELECTNMNPDYTSNFFSELIQKELKASNHITIKNTISVMLEDIENYKILRDYYFDLYYRPIFKKEEGNPKFLKAYLLESDLKNGKEIGKYFKFLPK